MQLGIYFDQTRCTGCHTCAVACKDCHDTPAGPARWMRISTIERGTYPHLFMAFLALPCLHCETPACLPACPAGAVSKDARGIVTVDSDLCLGNSACPAFCREACPYQAPQFQSDTGAKMEKCDLCADRWETGRLPICVEACPMRALDAGPLAELRARYGSGQEAAGFDYDSDVRPAIILRKR